MNDGKKITNLIVKLNKMTQSGDIKWKSISLRITLEYADEVVDKIYVTTYKSKFFRLFKYRSRHYTDEDVYHWTINWKLEITDENYNSEWTFPEEIAISDLYDSVRYQIAKVDDLINDLLTED